MRLLFDQNLSWRLNRALADLYPQSVHVRDVDLATADDAVVWDYARSNGLTILTKDADFHQRSFLFGAPPRVIWIRRGNCSTDDVINLLRQRRGAIAAFDEDSESAFLVLA
ncbi:MAG: DUF5615 family PIN-like protein [Deltaproteobacteria bacterium]|nr:DUF5615 family PIN-like protein [Deltaproteobacteria bacterium]